MIYYFLLLILAGLTGGFLGGLLGIGGGVIFIMFIPHALQIIGVPESEIVQYTIANSIFAIFFSSASSTYYLLRANTFYRKEVLYLGISAVLSSVLILNTFVNTPFYSKRDFNIIVIILLFLILVKTFFTKTDFKLKDREKVYSPLYLIIAGLFAGAISSLTGLGGGVIMVPLLHSFMKLNIYKSNAVSHGVICMTSFSMTINSLFETPETNFSYYSSGYIIFPVAVALSIGVVVASPYGVKASKKLSPVNLRYLFSIFVVFLIVKKLLEF
jgi:uncharacterized protein